jgi:hypothetical protein
MALLATMFTWTKVPAGVWTRFAAGPLVTGTPFEALYLASADPGGPSGSIRQSITFTLDTYSASPPFYTRDMNTISTFFFGAPPVGGVGDLAVLLALPLSPWVEFWLLTSRPCYAHIQMV